MTDNKCLPSEPQQEFDHIRKRYWGQRFWQRGYFSITSGNITDDTILRYLETWPHVEGGDKPGRWNASDLLSVAV